MSRYLNDIKNTKILEVYELNNNFEIVYEKDNIKKSLYISHRCSFGPSGNECWFEFSGVALLMQNSSTKKAISQRLVKIDQLIEINIYSDDRHNGVFEDLQIVYKNKENEICNYLLNSTPDDKEIHRLDIHKNQDSKLEKEKYSDEEFPKELYSTKSYKNILEFALKAHKEQKTPDGLPYTFHVVLVANEIINSLSMHRLSYDEANVAIACALLHDIKEDTEERVTHYNLPLGTVNPITIQRGVSALTKNATLPSRQEQLKDALKRLKEMPYCVQMVKLADRITNLAPAPLFWNKAKRQEYVNEAKEIYKALKDSNPYLASKLQNKIDNYLVSKILNKFSLEQNDDYIIFYDQDLQLILDKNHKDYLKAFKAIDGLNSYIFEKFEIKLFKRKHCNYNWINKEKKDIKKYTNRVGVDHIFKILNNKKDTKIENFMNIIEDTKKCIQL
jgi:hypothetical protein